MASISLANGIDIATLIDTWTPTSTIDPVEGQTEA
jgi:hypothetical protein